MKSFYSYQQPSVLYRNLSKMLFLLIWRRTGSKHLIVILKKNRWEKYLSKWKLNLYILKYFSTLGCKTDEREGKKDFTPRRNIIDNTVWVQSINQLKTSFCSFVRWRNHILFIALTFLMKYFFKNSLRARSSVF